MAKRSNVSNISNNLKEAVAEALLGNIYRESSGEGECGDIVLSERPSKSFSTGFLEPFYIANRGNIELDEMNNPVHIVATGMDFQAKNIAEGKLIIKPEFSVYVRILPNSDDLIKYKTFLQFSAQIKNEIRQAKSEAIKKFKDDNEDLYLENKSEYYCKKDEVVKNTVTTLLQSRYKVVFTEEMMPGKEDKMLANTDSSDDIENVDANDEEVVDDEISRILVAYPNMNSSIPNGVMDNAKVIQKWIRLDNIDIPVMEISTSSSSDQIDRLLEEYNQLLNQAIQDRIDAWLLDDNSERGGRLWAYPSDCTFTPNQIKNWDATLVDLRQTYHNQNKRDDLALPDINVRLMIDMSRDVENDSINNVRVTFENSLNVIPNRIDRDETENAVFQVGIKVCVPKNCHSFLMLDRVKPSYRYNNYLKYPAIGVNNGITYVERDGFVELATTWMPIYSQPRVRPCTYPGIDVSFQTLRTIDGVLALKNITDKYHQWINSVSKNVNPAVGAANQEQTVAENDRFTSDIEHWKKESQMITKGIELLIQSSKTFNSDPNDILAIPYKAWCMMQDAMGDVASRKGYHKWHLFQICFILSNIPGLVSRISEFHEFAYYDKQWDEDVSLLHFSTGGGKTEAFFGLLVFNLFLDRLRGKSIGVTSMIRYPLRLLTTQQAQRLAIVLACAERVRWKNNVGGNPFEIGFWVGSANTPNKRNDILSTQVPFFSKSTQNNEDKLLENADYLYADEAWNKMPKCPFCGSKTVLRKYRNRNGLIGHACSGSEELCDWNKRHEGSMKVPLPFYIVDEDIYEVAPSVLLGTVDKLALIAQSPSTIRRFFGMFGLSAFIDSSANLLISPINPTKFTDYLSDDNADKLYPMFDDGKHIFVDPFPSLIIQDEAHLLEESLGTFAGLFESIFETILCELGCNKRLNSIIAKKPDSSEPRMPKIIAASATVSEPENQMEALFLRGVVQFPWPGPHLYSSFYSEPVAKEGELYSDDLSEEQISQTARFYSSLMTNGKPHTSATVGILAIFHLIISRLANDFTSDDVEKISFAKDYLIKGIKGAKLKQLYSRCILDASADDLATIIDLHRISLTYVTTKKGGDQIMAAENDAAYKIHINKGYNQFKGLASDLISGGVSSGDIEAVVKRAQDRPVPGGDMNDIFDEELLRSIVTTSAISHGVDVDEFNSMFFAGIPYSIAEYIQASSRVGRTHVGFSLLIPTPQRRRDRYILEINDIYHRFLERMLRPAAVNRWAENAIKRCMASIFQAYMIAFIENLELLESDNVSKSNVGDYGKINIIVDYINNSGDTKFKIDFLDFVYKAVGLSHPEYAPSAIVKFKDILKFEASENIIDTVIDNQKKFASLSELFKSRDSSDQEMKRSPMTSLRDIDPQGLIVYQKQGTVDATEDQIRDIIKLLSRRRTTRGA